MWKGDDPKVLLPIAHSLKLMKRELKPGADTSERRQSAFFRENGTIIFNPSGTGELDTPMICREGRI